MNAAAILLLAEKGLTALDIAEVAAALEHTRDRTGAERQARYRDRIKVTRDVTRNEVTDKPLPPLPPLKFSPDPNKITPPISPNPIVEDVREPVEVLWEVVNAIAEGVRKKLPPPLGVEKGQWRAFRQQRKKALTDRAYLMICNKLAGLAEAGWPPGEMIDLAIERGWETVFEPKDQGNGQANRGNNGRMGGPRPDPTLALVRAAAAAQREDGRDHGQARPALPAGQFR